MGSAPYEADANDPAASHDTVTDPDRSSTSGGWLGSSACGRRVAVVAAVLVVAGLVGAGAWWYGTVHPAMDLGSSSVLSLCIARQTPTERDLVIGQVAFTAPAEVDLLSINLLDPVNVTLADARIAPIVSPPDGGYTIPGLTRGWPLTAADRAGYTLDWSAERPLAGATLTAGVQEAPILHVQILDPTRDASYRAWQVVYRMNGTRRVSTFTHSLRAPGAIGPNTCG